MALPITPKGIPVGKKFHYKSTRPYTMRKTRMNICPLFSKPQVTLELIRGQSRMK